MRVIGLDLGTKTIGLALSDETGMIAQPLMTIRRSTLTADIDELLRVALGYEVESIVIGMPINLDGTRGERAEYTAKFVARLKGRTSLPVTHWDERMSTATVTRVLLDADVTRSRRKAVVDKMAAAYILQGYLDSLRLDGDIR